MRIYAGNLNYSMTSAELKAIFEEYGTVTSSEVIVDRNSNQSKGFGFVEMADEAEAKSAIEALDGKEVAGRNIKVSQARAKRYDTPLL